MYGFNWAQGQHQHFAGINRAKESDYRYWYSDHSTARRGAAVAGFVAADVTWAGLRRRLPAPVAGVLCACTVECLTMATGTLRVALKPHAYAMCRGYVEGNEAHPACHNRLGSSTTLRAAWMW